MGYNMGQEVTKQEANLIGKKIQEDILNEMPKGDRISLDLELISEPDDFEFHRDDLSKNYSATYDWLQKFSEFCLKCNGFNVS